MTQTLADLSNVTVLVVGDLMLDRYWWGDVERISPEAPVPIVRLARTSVSAGGAANVSANIGGLGAKAVLLGITGDDPESAELENILAAQTGVEAHLVRFSDRPTTVKTRIVAHNQHVVRLDREIADKITDEQAGVLVDRLRSLVDGVDAVIVSDYAKGMLTEHVIAQLIAAANAAAKMVFVDPKGKDFTKYRGATMITPNLLEAANACGLELNDPKLVAHAGTSMLEQFDLSHVLITEGANGMTLFDPDGVGHHLDAYARNVYDVTGAGDTVIATFAVAAGSGMSFIEAAQLANIAAGIAVGQVGTAVVTRSQIEIALGSGSAR